MTKLIVGMLALMSLTSAFAETVVCKDIEVLQKGAHQTLAVGIKENFRLAVGDQYVSIVSPVDAHHYTLGNRTLFVKKVTFLEQSKGVSVYAVKFEFDSVIARQNKLVDKADHSICKVYQD